MCWLQLLKVMTADEAAEEERMRLKLEKMDKMERMQVKLSYRGIVERGERVGHPPMSKWLPGACARDAIITALPMLGYRSTFLELKGAQPIC